MGFCFCLFQLDFFDFFLVFSFDQRGGAHSLCPPVPRRVSEPFPLDQDVAEGPSLLHHLCQDHSIEEQRQRCHHRPQQRQQQRPHHRRFLFSLHSLVHLPSCLPFPRHLTLAVRSTIVFLPLCLLVPFPHILPRLL